MSQNDPEVLRAEIARTRAELSDNVDTLTETANPKNIAAREVSKVKGAVRKVRDHLMGSPDDPTDDGVVGDRAGAVKGAVGDAQGRAAGVVQQVGDAPRQIQRRTRGNPLAAGLIAFGIGYLISGAIPSTTKEQEAAGRLQDAAAPLKEKVSDLAGEVGDRLREPAQDALASVKSTAADAATAVREEGASAKDDIAGQVQESKTTVQDR